VLYGNGVVQWQSTPLVGRNHDNIYTYGKSGDGATSGGEGIEGSPVSADDSVLLPTAKMGPDVPAARPTTMPDNPRTAQSWTLEDARQRLRLSPRDVYLQYVALQLARRENASDEVAAEIEQFTGAGGSRARRAGNVDAFSLFTGSL